MYIEFKEMEQGVVKVGYGAVDVFFTPVVQLEWAARLVTGGKRDINESSFGVGDLEGPVSY